MAIALGIDLGTTNSCAAVATPTGVEFILGQRAERVHPSVVAFPAAGGIVVLLTGLAAVVVVSRRSRLTFRGALRIAFSSRREPAV